MTDLKSIDLDNPSRQDLRVIDAAVAEHVFGHKIEWVAAGNGSFIPFYKISSGRAPSYSTDPGLIFEIVEAMGAKGWTGCVESRENPFDGSGWKAEFRIYVDKIIATEIHRFTHVADSPALAVSIAALKALEVLPKEDSDDNQHVG